MYFNGREFVDGLLRYMQENNVWHDEFALNNVIDQHHGGWPGERVWLQLYENPVFCVADHRSPWARIPGTCDDVIHRRTPVPFVWYKMLTHHHSR